MRIMFNPIKFCSSQKSYTDGHYKITKHYDDNDVLVKQIKYDEFERDVDVEWFDKFGNIIGKMHKDYFDQNNEKGYVETFKDESQEYIRKAYTKIESGLKHVVDDFKSKSKPENSYFNEFIYDLQNHLIEVISGKNKYNLE